MTSERCCLARAIGMSSHDEFCTRAASPVLVSPSVSEDGAMAADGLDPEKQQASSGAAPTTNDATIGGGAPQQASEVKPSEPAERSAGLSLAELQERVLALEADVESLKTIERLRWIF